MKYYEFKDDSHLLQGTIHKIERIQFEDLLEEDFIQFPILRWARNNNMSMNSDNMCFIEIVELLNDSSKGQFLLYSEEKYKGSPFKTGDKLSIRNHSYFGWMPLVKSGFNKKLIKQSPEGLSYKQYKDLLVIDIETSNEKGIFDSRAAEIIEIAVVQVTSDFKTSVLLNQVVQPRNWEQFEKSWINSQGYIPLKEVKSAPTSEQVAERLHAIFTKKKNWTAFNTKFELDHLQRDPWNISWVPYKDIAEATNRYFGTDINETEYRSSYLKKLFAFYHLTDFSHQEKHRALDCAYMEVEILRHLTNLEVYEFPFEWIF